MYQTLLCWTQTAWTSLRFAGLVNKTKFSFLCWFPGSRTCQVWVPVLPKGLAELPHPRAFPEAPTQIQEFSFCHKIGLYSIRAPFPVEPWLQVGFLLTNELHTQLMAFIIWLELCAFFWPRNKKALAVPKTLWRAVFHRPRKGFLSTQLSKWLQVLIDIPNYVSRNKLWVGKGAEWTHSEVSGGFSWAVQGWV